MFDPARLVFLDETATSTNMVRLRGRCPRGQRLIAHVPHGHWKTITFVAGLRRRAVVAPLVLDGPMNATIFVTYLKECLAPKLKRGDVVIMDNLPVHRVAAVREVIEEAGAKLRYLPKYSLDLNPIEQAFSKLKAHLRKAAERTIPRLSRRSQRCGRNAGKHAQTPICQDMRLGDRAAARAWRTRWSGRHGITTGVGCSALRILRPQQHIFDRSGTGRNGEGGRS